MAKNTREMMHSLISHLTNRVRNAPDDAFGSGQGAALDFVFDSIRETIEKGDRGRASLTEQEKQERMLLRAPFYVHAVRALSKLGIKVTPGRILGALENENDLGMDFPRSEQGIAADLRMLAQNGSIEEKKTDKGRVYYTAK